MQTIIHPESARADAAGHKERNLIAFDIFILQQFEHIARRYRAGQTFLARGKTPPFHQSCLIGDRQHLGGWP